MTSINHDVAHQTRKRVELRVEARCAATNLEDLFVREADVLADHRVRSEAVFAAVHLTDHEIHHFARLSYNAALSTLESEVVGKRMFGMRENCVKIRYEAEFAFQVVEDSLIGGRHFLARRDVDGSYANSPYLRMKERGALSYG